MKKYSFLAILIAFSCTCIVLPGVYLYAQDAQEQELADGRPFFTGGSSKFVVSQRSTPPVVPPGMELIRIGTNTEIVAPQGLKIYKEGALSVMETSSAYMVRRFLDVEKRLKEIEEQEKELKEELDKLKETVEGMKQKESNASGGDLQ